MPDDNHNCPAVNNISDPEKRMQVDFGASPSEADATSKDLRDGASVIDDALPEPLLKQGITSVRILPRQVVVTFKGQDIEVDRDLDPRKTIRNFHQKCDEIIGDKVAIQAAIVHIVKGMLQVNHAQDLKDTRTVRPEQVAVPALTGRLLPVKSEVDSLREIRIDRLERLDRHITIVEALHRNSGRVVVQGLIVAASQTYKLIKYARWICNRCRHPHEREIFDLLRPPRKPKKCIRCECDDLSDAHDYINAASLYLQDDVVEAGLDSLHVIVFERDTRDVRVGEQVRVIGQVHETQEKDRIYHAVVLAQSVTFLQRKAIQVTPADVLAIKRFAGKIPLWGTQTRILTDLHARLISLVAPNVVGHQDKKGALLLSLFGAPEKADKQRGRIHVLAVGPPGLAKTREAREAAAVIPNSRYVSKNTTGKSLTGMITEENGEHVLTLGPIPLARNAICVLNEFDKLDPAEQDHVLDVMEEGTVTINKYARLVAIPSPTTIIATANPRGSQWMQKDRVELDELPFEHRLLSRFDIWLVYRDSTEPDAVRDFAYAKIAYDEKGISHNYHFLQKYIQYAKTINPTITDDACSVLVETYVTLKARAPLLVTPRTLESLFRISKAMARMQLDHIVDVSAAKQTADLVTSMYREFDIQTTRVRDPQSAAYEDTLEVIRRMKGGQIGMTDAIRLACEENDQVKRYLGTNLQQSSNRKARRLTEMILENKNNIQIVQAKPIVVRWQAGENRMTADKLSQASHTSLGQEG